MPLLVCSSIWAILIMQTLESACMHEEQVRSPCHWSSRRGRQFERPMLLSPLKPPQHGDGVTTAADVPDSGMTSYLLDNSQPASRLQIGAIDNRDNWIDRTSGICGYATSSMTLLYLQC